MLYSLILVEAIVVSTGEMQAEYVLSPQENVSPLLMSPVQVSVFFVFLKINMS